MHSWCRVDQAASCPTEGGSGVAGERSADAERLPTGAGPERSQSTIRAIRPSASAAPPDTGSTLETMAGSGRVTSSRWPMRSSTARATRLSSRADDHHELVVGALAAAEDPPAVHQRQHAVVQDEHAAAGDRPDGVLGEAQGALDPIEGDRVGAAGDLDLQRDHDRQRQGQPDLRQRAAAERGVHHDFATQLADLGAHGVHAHAAPGDVVGRLDGGEAWREQQLDGGLHVDVGSCRGVDQSCSRALAATRAGSIPRPSSRTSMMTLPPA